MQMIYDDLGDLDRAAIDYYVNAHYLSNDPDKKYTVPKNVMGNERQEATRDEYAHYMKRYVALYENMGSVRDEYKSHLDQSAKIGSKSGPSLG